MPNSLVYIFSTLCILLVTLIPQPACGEKAQQNSSAKQASVAGAEKLLVGLYINSVLKKEDIIYREKDEYWIPLSLFLETTDLKEEGRTGSIARYKTSLGVISFNTDSLKKFNDFDCISSADLKSTFVVSADFNQPLFAIMLTVPWNPWEMLRRDEVSADIKAPGSSLSSIGIQAQGAYDSITKTSQNLLLAAAGRAAGGVWNVTAEGDPATSLTPSHYNWTTFNNNVAVRLGTGYSGSYSLVGSTFMTGVQLGWNNHSILKQLDSEQNSSASDVFLNLDTNQTKNLEGFAPPATIAELRFDGIVQGWIRVAIDGRFSFENVRMGSDLRKTEVYIYQNSINEKPIKVIDFSQPISSRSLPKGELLVRGGVGKSGNLLDNQSFQLPATITSFGNLTYGLTDRITVESALQQNPTTGRPDILGGTLFSIGEHWTTSLYEALSNGENGTDVRLEGRYKFWDLVYWGTMRGENYGADATPSDLNHSLRWSGNPFRQLGLQVIARYEKQGDVVLRRFVLPAGTLTPFSWLNLSATPDDDGNYRYDAGIRLGDHYTLNASTSNSVISADYQYGINEYLSMRIYDDYALKTKMNLTNLAIDWHPNHYSNDFLSTIISYSSGSFGISGSWNHNINTGLRLAMQYSYNMNNVNALYTTTPAMGSLLPALTPTVAQKSVAMTLSWDLGWSNKGLFPINRNAVTLTRGAIAGSLDIANGTKLSSSDINNVSILLNGQRLQQNQIDGSFFVGSLPPGIYGVSVDPEKLPIELVINQKELKVEVKNGAVTGLNIPVYAEYGVAGMVSDNVGNGIANVIVEVTDKENKIVQQTLTNEFGYYRADTLRSGTYQIAAQSQDGKPIINAPKRTFTIKDDFLFDVNLTIAK